LQRLTTEIKNHFLPQIEARISGTAADIRYNTLKIEALADSLRRSHEVLADSKDAFGIHIDALVNRLLVFEAQAATVRKRLEALEKAVRLFHLQKSTACLTTGTGDRPGVSMCYLVATFCL
jgi:hypothetical protein